MQHDDNNNDKYNKQNKVKEFPKYKKYLTLVNEKTGEIEGHFPLKNKGLGTGWIALYQHPAAWLAQQNLTGEQYKVILYLFSQLNFDNYLRVSRKRISEWTGIHQINVSKAMKVLKDMDIIVEGPRAGLNKTYRLNPNIAHKGRDKDQTAIDFSDEKRRRRPKSNEDE